MSLIGSHVPTVFGAPSSPLQPPLIDYASCDWSRLKIGKYTYLFTQVRQYRQQEEEGTFFKLLGVKPDTQVPKVGPVQQVHDVAGKPAFDQCQVPDQCILRGVGSESGKSPPVRIQSLNRRDPCITHQCLTGGIHSIHQGICEHVHSGFSSNLLPVIIHIYVKKKLKRM